MKPRIDITRDPHPDYPALEYKFTVHYADGRVCGHGWRATHSEAEAAAKKTAEYRAREHIGGGKMDCKLTVEQLEASRLRGHTNSKRGAKNRNTKKRPTGNNKAAAQRRRPDYFDVINTRWHGAPPDWVAALARALNTAESQHKLAEQIGSQASAISAALHNSKHHAAVMGVTKLERRVRQHLMQPTEA